MTRKSRSQFTGRAHPAEDHVADGTGSLAAPEPDIEYGVDIGIFPGEDKRTACEQEKHHRLAGSGQASQQFLLHIGELYVGTRCRFPTHFCRLTQGGNDYIGL